MQVIQRTRRWTEDEDNYIRNNYLNMSDEEIGNVLGRSKSGIKSERNKLQLVRPRKPHSTQRKYLKLTFEQIKQIFVDKDYELLSDESEYINQSSKMRYICNKHRDKGEQSISVYHLKEGKGCYYCGRERTQASRKSKATSEEDEKLCELKGFTYIKTEVEDGKTYIYFICNKHKILGMQKMTRGNMNRQEVHGCQYCSGKNLPHWYVKHIIESTCPNIKVLSEFQGMNKPIDCYCTVHNEHFTQIAKEVFYYGRGCKSCWHENLSKNQLLSKDEVEKRLLEKNPDMEILNLDEYSGWETRMRLRCKNCGEIWEQPFHSAIRNSCRCPKCQRKNTIGEEAIANQLLKNNVSYIPQYRFNDCKYKNTFPFDFAILDKSQNVVGLIEYQGEQHYKPIAYFGGEDKYQVQITRDNIKKEYCELHNIPLLTIPYWDFEKVNEIVDNFINNIL